LKLVCHFSVKQKSGRKRKPREGEDPPLDSPSPRAKSAPTKSSGGGSGKSAAALAATAAASAAASSAAAAAAAAARGGGGSSSVSSSPAVSAATTWANGESERSGNGRSDEGSTSDGGEGNSIQIACDPCLRRRRRCNGERPCGGCARADQGEHCVYPVKRKMTSSKPVMPRQKHRREDAATLLNMSAAHPGPAADRLPLQKRHGLAMKAARQTPSPPPPPPPHGASNPNRGSGDAHGGDARPSHRGSGSARHDSSSGGADGVDGHTASGSASASPSPSPPPATNASGFPGKG
ncbi:unnamed protein product, partial [Laminaria digitata]